MIRINLLPVDIQGASERQLNPKIVVSAVVASFVIFLIPFSLVHVARRKTLREEVATVQSSLERFKPIVAQVELLEQAKSQLEQRKSIIQQLENERLRYPYFMEDFIKLLPNNVWLMNLTTTLPPDNLTLSVGMDVVALDHYAVADMVSNLETSQIFSDIDVGPITLTQSAPGSQSITFHVGTTYRKAASTTNAPKKS